MNRQTMDWDLLAPAIREISVMAKTPKGTAVVDHNAAQVRLVFEAYGLSMDDEHTLFTACALLDILRQGAVQDHVEGLRDVSSSIAIVEHLQAFLGGLVPYLPEEVRHG